MRLLGFIVVGNGCSQIGGVLSGPKEGVLLSGQKVTVFGTRGAADRAIDRTKKYEREHGLNWNTKLLHVLPLGKYAAPGTILPPPEPKTRPERDAWNGGKAKKFKNYKFNESAVVTAMLGDRLTCEECPRPAFYSTNFPPSKGKHYCENHKQLAKGVYAPNISINA